MIDHEYLLHVYFANIHLFILFYQNLHTTERCKNIDQIFIDIHIWGAEELKIHMREDICSLTKYKPLMEKEHQSSHFQYIHPMIA